MNKCMEKANIFVFEKHLMGFWQQICLPHIFLVMFDIFCISLYSLDEAKEDSK